MTLVDLSHPITTGMPVYPGDPQVSMKPALHIDTDGANVAQLTLGSHTGTHLDAPAHAVAGGRTVDQIDLELLHGTASIMQVQGPASARSIGIDDLAPLPDQLSNIVCIATGWDRYFHDSLREQHPYIGIELARALWQRGARVLGVDTLSPDPTAEASAQIPVHDFWLGNDGIIVENLKGLTGLPDRVELSMLPLNLIGCDGSPVRAVARK